MIFFFQCVKLYFELLKILFNSFDNPQIKAEDLHFIHILIAVFKSVVLVCRCKIE